MDFFGLTQESPFLPYLIYGLNEFFFDHGFECVADGEFDNDDIIIGGVGGTPKVFFEIANQPEVTGTKVWTIWRVGNEYFNTF